MNTVIQVTSNPLQVSVTVNKGNYTHELIKDSCVFNVSMLTTETPMKVFEHFGFQSGRTVNKFADCETEHRAVNHVLYIPKYTNAYLACRVNKSIDFGTHTMFIADVLDAQVLSDKPSVTYDYYQKTSNPNHNPRPRSQRMASAVGSARFAVISMKEISSPMISNVHCVNTAWRILRRFFR